MRPYSGGVNQPAGLCHAEGKGESLRRQIVSGEQTYKVKASGVSNKGVLLAPPFIVVLAVTLTVLMLLFPYAVVVAAAVPLLLFVSAQALRPLLGACLAGNSLMLYGSTGEVEFLGRLIIEPSTTAAAILFSNTLAVTVYVMSCRRRLEKVAARTPIPISVHIFLLSLASILLLTRFTGGIPVLQGDSGRLNGVLTTNPYLGLFSGVMPIAAAFLNSKKSKIVLALKVLVIVLVVGTASRLLLGAVLVGFISSSRIVRGGLSAKARFYLAVAGIGTIFAVTKIYSARTAEGIQQIYESRLGQIGGFPGWLSDIIGPSLFYAARNGLVIHEIVSDNHLNPPNGFVWGGLLRVLNLNIDPEIWLTTAIGFNVSAVGAIATPIWAGAHADYGMLGTCLVALACGLVFSLVLLKVPELEYWISFGILLSFYGSYLVSSQFIVASGIVLIVAVWSKKTRFQNGVALEGRVQ